MSWAIPLEFARFANTSEIKIDETIRQKIDGVLIKSISGCDEIQVRNNYTNERTMKIQAGTSLMANDIGNATPTDNLVKETRIGDALFWVLVDNYSTVKPKMTPDMKEFRDQFLEKDDFKIINDIFTITKDKDNFVENKDMEAFIRNKQLNMTLIKLQNYLIKRGAKRDIVLINKVSKRGLTNLIKLEIPDDD